MTQLQAYRALSAGDAASGDEFAMAERWASTTPEESRQVIASWDVPEEAVQRVIRDLGLNPS